MNALILRNDKIFEQTTLALNFYKKLFCVIQRSFLCILCSSMKKLQNRWCFVVLWVVEHPDIMEVVMVGVIGEKWVNEEKCDFSLPVFDYRI